MKIRAFSIESPELAADVIVKAIETAIPQELIDEGIAKTGCKEDRNRKLPTQLVSCMVIAMSLWASDSMKEVLKNLIQGSKRFQTTKETHSIKGNKHFLYSSQTGRLNSSI